MSANTSTVAVNVVADFVAAGINVVDRIPKPAEVISKAAAAAVDIVAAASDVVATPETVKTVPRETAQKPTESEILAKRKEMLDAMSKLFVDVKCFIGSAPKTVARCVPAITAPLVAPKPVEFNVVPVIGYKVSGSDVQDVVNVVNLFIENYRVPPCVAVIDGRTCVVSLTTDSDAVSVPATVNCRPIITGEVCRRQADGKIKKPVAVFVDNEPILVGMRSKFTLLSLIHMNEKMLIHPAFIRRMIVNRSFAGSDESSYDGRTMSSIFKASGRVVEKNE